MRPGPTNTITDVAGLLVGQAEDRAVRSGVTVVMAESPFVAGVSVMGGAPGTRETDLLAPDRSVLAVDALVLAGGSAFGLGAAEGVVQGLRAMGRGFAVGPHRVPIVPAAILFDLTGGGDTGWTVSPYPELGRRALARAGREVRMGSVGAGTGATTANLKGGLGSASAVLAGGINVGAIVAVNAIGSAILGEGPEFWAAPFEEGAEFGGLGPASRRAGAPVTKLGAHREATTIAVVATDAVLTKAQCTRLATAAQDGIARALVPAHTPMDGDLIFAAATGVRPLADPVADTLRIGHAAATCLARAIARAVWLATPAPGDPMPTWGERFGPAGTVSNRVSR